jgi:hypothetical protein
MKCFLRLLESDEFRSQLDMLGGYTTDKTGEIIRINP